MSPATYAAAVEQLRETLPPVFAGPAVDQLTGGAIHWPTIQNKRSKREIPDGCFMRSGRRVLVRRDEFLDWWATTLSDARQTSHTPPPPPRAGRRPPRRHAAEALPVGE
jgi:hypothetical protein